MPGGVNFILRRLIINRSLSPPAWLILCFFRAVCPLCRQTNTLKCRGLNDLTWSNLQVIIQRHSDRSSGQNLTLSQKVPWQSVAVTHVRRQGKISSCFRPVDWPQFLSWQVAVLKFHTKQKVKFTVVKRRTGEQARILGNRLKSNGHHLSRHVDKWWRKTCLGETLAGSKERSDGATS